MATLATDPTIQKQLIGLYRQALLQGVPLHDLEKKVHKQLKRLEVNEHVERQEEKQRAERVKRKLPRVVRLGSVLLPLVFMSVGLYLVGSAVVPILGYYFSTGSELETSGLTAPIPQEQVMEITPLVITGTAQASSGENQVSSGPTIIDEELDFTNLANWFAEAQLPELDVPESGSEAIEYTLEIPELDIYNAKVTVGGTDLNKNLIAYPGTAAPGEAGAPVIFGHSVLRQFYNPSEKNPRRYNSIFSYLMDLKAGDRIYLKTGNVTYTYVVQSKTEVKPEDVHILTQQYDASRLKLVTCTPPGTYLRRGVVTAQLLTGPEEN